MHLYTGDTKIVFRKVFSPKIINKEAAYKSSTIFDQLVDFRIEGESKTILYYASKYSVQKSIRDLVNVKHTI